MSILRSARLSFFLVAFFMLAPCLVAYAATMTLVTVSGTTYPMISYEIDQEKQVVSLEVDGWKRPIKFQDIKAILDAEGNDVTATILGRPAQQSTAASPKETWRSKNDPVLAVSRHPLWWISLHLGPCGSLPTSGYYEGFTSGIGYGGDLEISLNRDISLLLSAWRTGVRVGHNLKFVSNDPDRSILQQTITSRTMRYFVSGLYHQPNNRSRPSKGHWYAYSGIGAIDDHVSGTGLAVDHSNNLYQLVITGGGTHFAIAIGAGDVVMFSPSVGVDFGAGVDELFGRSQDGTGTGSAFVFHLKAALVLALPVKQKK